MSEPVTTLDELAVIAFPAILVEFLATRYESLTLGFNVVRRMPRNSDANYTIGVVPITKTPDQDTNEMRGPNSFVGPTNQQLVIVIYAFVKDSDHTRGMATHSVLAEIVESMLVDDLGTRAGLAVLEATVLGITKKVARFWVRQTRYISNELGGTNQFMSATELIVELEKSK